MHMFMVWTTAEHILMWWYAGDLIDQTAYENL